MDTTSLSYFIAYTGVYSLVLTLVVAAYRYQYLRGPVLIFAVLQGINMIFTVLSTTVFLATNNAFLSFITTGIDALAMSWMYALLMPTRLWQRAVGWFGPLFVGALLADFLWWEGPVQMGNNIAAGAECLFVSAFLLVYIRQLFGDPGIGDLRKHPLFLISVTVLGSSIIAAPIYFFAQPLMSYSMSLAMRAYDLMYLTALASHILYAIAFWFTKTETLASRVV